MGISYSMPGSYILMEYSTFYATNCTQNPALECNRHESSLIRTAMPAILSMRIWG